MAERGYFDAQASREANARYQSQYLRSAVIARHTSWLWILGFALAHCVLGFGLGSMVVRLTAHLAPLLVSHHPPDELADWSSAVLVASTLSFGLVGCVVAYLQRSIIRAIVPDDQRDWHRRYLAAYDASNVNGYLHSTQELHELLAEGRTLGIR